MIAMSRLQRITMMSLGVARCLNLRRLQEDGWRMMISKTFDDVSSVLSWQHSRAAVVFTANTLGCAS